MKFENIRVMNFENALRGMRNPKESWDLIDSNFTFVNNGEEKISTLEDSVNIWMDKIEQLTGERSQEMYEMITEFLYVNGTLYEKNNISEVAYIGPNDMKLARQLIRAGSEHRKFLRQIFVSIDIIAPLYW